MSIINERNGALLYSIPIQGGSFQPKVFEKGTYTIRLEIPDLQLTRELEGVKSIDLTDTTTLNIGF